MSGVQSDHVHHAIALLLSSAAAVVALPTASATTNSSATSESESESVYHSSSSSSTVTMTVTNSVSASEPLDWHAYSDPSNRNNFTSSYSPSSTQPSDKPALVASSAVPSEFPSFSRFVTSEHFFIQPAPTRSDQLNSDISTSSSASSASSSDISTSSTTSSSVSTSIGSKSHEGLIDSTSSSSSSQQDKPAQISRSRSPSSSSRPALDVTSLKSSSSDSKMEPNIPDTPVPSDRTPPVTTESSPDTSSTTSVRSGSIRTSARQVPPTPTPVGSVSNKIAIQPVTLSLSVTPSGGGSDNGGGGGGSGGSGGGTSPMAGSDGPVQPSPSFGGSVPVDPAGGSGGGNGGNSKSGPGGSNNGSGNRGAGGNIDSANDGDNSACGVRCTIGPVLGSIAVLVVMIAAFLLWRRRRAHASLVASRKRRDTIGAYSEKRYDGEDDDDVNSDGNDGSSQYAEQRRDRYLSPLDSAAEAASLVRAAHNHPYGIMRRSMMEMTSPDARTAMLANPFESASSLGSYEADALTDEKARFEADVDAFNGSGYSKVQRASSPVENPFADQPAEPSPAALMADRRHEYGQLAPAPLQPFRTTYLDGRRGSLGAAIRPSPPKILNKPVSRPAPPPPPPPPASSPLPNAGQRLPPVMSTKSALTINTGPHQLQPELLRLISATNCNSNDRAKPVDKVEGPAPPVLRGSISYTCSRSDMSSGGVVFIPSKLAHISNDTLSTIPEVDDCASSHYSCGDCDECGKMETCSYSSSSQGRSDSSHSKMTSSPTSTLQPPPLLPQLQQQPMHKPSVFSGRYFADLAGLKF